MSLYPVAATTTLCTAPRAITPPAAPLPGLPYAYHPPVCLSVSHSAAALRSSGHEWFHGLPGWAGGAAGAGGKEGGTKGRGRGVGVSTTPEGYSSGKGVKANMAVLCVANQMAVLADAGGTVQFAA